MIRAKKNQKTITLLETIKHNLRTPLISIRGFAQLLKKEKVINNPEINKRYVEIIYRNSERLQNSLNELEEIIINKQLIGERYG